MKTSEFKKIVINCPITVAVFQVRHVANVHPDYPVEAGDLVWWSMAFGSFMSLSNKRVVLHHNNVVFRGYAPMIDGKVDVFNNDLAYHSCP